MRFQNLPKLVLTASLLLVGAAAGCDTKRNQESSQTVRPDGTAVQSRSQDRQTSSGTTVRETETRERKVIDPGPGVTNTDATKSDPGSTK